MLLILHCIALHSLVISQKRVLKNLSQKFVRLRWSFNGQFNDVQEVSFVVFSIPRGHWSQLDSKIWLWSFEMTCKIIGPFCLVLLSDQNSFGRSKMVLVWLNWFGLDHNELVMTKMKWSRPKWICQVQIVIHFSRKSQFGPDQFILVATISFWSWPNHYGQVQINLVRPKPFCTDQNCFGHIEGQGISSTTLVCPILFICMHLSLVVK